MLTAINVVVYGASTNATVFVDNVLNPLLVPSICANLVNQLLACVKGLPEAIGGTLGVGNVGREEEVAIRGERLHHRRINLTAHNRDFRFTRLAQLSHSLLRPLVLHGWESLLQHSNHLLILIASQNSLGDFRCNLSNLL